MKKKSKKKIDNGIKEITNVENVGMVLITLDEILKKRNLSVTMTSKRTATAISLINRYCSNKNEKGTDLNSVDLQVLARICYALDCEISDILRYEPPEHVKE